MINYTSYSYDSIEDCVVLEVNGRLDDMASKFLLDCIQGYIESGTRHFILDCRELQYVSSMGLGTLVRANSRLGNDTGTISLVGVRGIVADTLRIVRFDKVFHMYQSIDDAASAIQEIIQSR